MPNAGFWAANTEGTKDRLNAALIQHGTLAARPSAGEAGRLYVITSGPGMGSWYRDTGSAWLGLPSQSPWSYRKLGTHFAPGISITPASKAVVANTLYAMPFYVARPHRVTAIAIHILTADASNSNLRMGIYKDDGLVSPDALIVDAGVVDVSSTGQKSVGSMTTNLTEAGLYWVSFVADGTPNATGARGSAPWHAQDIHLQTPSFTGGPASKSRYRSFTYASLPDPWGSDLASTVNFTMSLAFAEVP